MLEVSQLTLSLKRGSVWSPLVQDLSFSIQKGQTLALVGESGSGKSLTALASVQLLPEGIYVHKSSQILFHNHNILHFSEEKMCRIRGKRIAMIVQDALAAFNPVLTLGQQLQEVLQIHEPFLNQKERLHKIFYWLDQVGLNEPERCYRSYPHQLSGGMRQRLLIAMALLPEPELLIADEPTTALDMSLQIQILDSLRSIQKKTNMGLLLITHDLSIVRSLADEILVLKSGKKVEWTPCKVFFKHPQTQYGQALLSALPSFNRLAWKAPDLDQKEGGSKLQVSVDGNSHGDFSLEAKPSIPNTGHFLSRIHTETTKEEPNSVQNQQMLLEVEHLKVYFPLSSSSFFKKQFTQAVDDISFQIHSGRSLALVGESGSGKTSTAKAILRLLKPSAGKIRFLGQEHLKASEFRKEVQVIFQDPYSALNPKMPVSKLLAEGMSAQGLGNLQERAQRIDELLLAVGLSLECKERYPHEFSGGQRQRLCIARALTLNPKLLICDEPTSALDVLVQKQIIQLLKKLKEERGLTYLLITHNLALVQELAQDVAVMYQGQIVEQGEVSEVLRSPQHPYTQRLIASCLL